MKAVTSGVVGGLLISALNLTAQFVAFNDGGDRYRSHPFTTLYSVSYFDQGTVVQGPLRDIHDGTFLPAYLRIEGGVMIGVNSTNFSAGTPAALMFGCEDSTPCIVDFRGPSQSLSGTMTYTFSGLNPARRYQFVGTANISVPSLASHRTLYGLHGADSFVSAHTSNCLTSAQLSTMSSNEVLLPTGQNALPTHGDMVIWDDIRPGMDGGFTVTAGRFQNEVGVPFGGLRLVEDFVEATAPFVGRHPASVAASRGSSQSLAPVVSGSLPLSFQWFHDGVPVPAATNRTLRFSPLEPTDAGIYWLVATNPYGTITTSNVTVTVDSNPIRIVSQPQDRALRYGDPLILSVGVTGAAPHFIQWFKEGSPIANATTTVFQVGAADLPNVGWYFARASNLFNAAVSRTATVNVVLLPLRWLEQPQSVVTTQGQGFRLRASVDGSGPLFRWFRNGTLINGATSSVYRVVSATPSHAGDYVLVAGNIMNTITSEVVSVTVAPPPPPSPWFNLLTLTNEWAYDQSARDLGTAWREVEYDDSSWPRGRGVLARENSLPTTLWTNTVLRLTTDSGQPIITTYFRTHFTWPSNALGAALVFSNLIDDGAVFYLNGVPLFRTNMPSGIITSSTLATSASLEGAFTRMDVEAQTMVEGDNVLAVEVHQNSPTSSDIVFGTAVFGYLIPDVPLTIVRHPHSQTVREGDPFELHFELNAPAHFLWYHDGVELASVVGPRAIVASAIPAHAGSYHVVATNSLGAVTSAVAVVQVIADVRPPRVLAAVLQTNRTRLLVEFDEALPSGMATNIDFYRVTTSDGSVAADIVSARYSNRVVELSLAFPAPDGTNLILRVDGVADVSTASNLIPNVHVPIHQFMLLVPLEGIWKYDDRGLDLGTAWRGAPYDDSLWPSGPAMFYNDYNYGVGDITLPDPPVLATNTWIQMTNFGVPVVTHYFRRPVDFGAVSLLGAQLSLQTMIDDGAVMYLNGSEFFRLGVDADPVYATNLASRARGTSMEVFMEGPFIAEFPSGFSSSASNVLAVETHQINPVDVSFGAEIHLRFKSFTNSPPVILRQPADVVVTEGQPFAFDVDSIGGVSAQWLRNGMPIDGVQGETYSVEQARMVDDGSLFAMSLSNSLGTVLSGSATLHVLPDTNAPQLVSAWAGASLTEIRLTFTEPIDPASVTNLGQFQLRDEQGQSVTITSTTLIDETTLLLTTMPRAVGHDYEVRLDGLRDLAAVPNQVDAGTRAIVGYELPVVPLNAVWRYDQSGNGLVDAWKYVSFDDATWLSGAALLYNDTFASAPPAVPPTTFLSITNAQGVPIVVHYFRHVFEMPVLAPGASLWMRHAFDDALVLHLNGQEIFRTNVPAGVVDATTLASGGVGDAVLSDPTPIQWAGASGLTVLAAETHQTSTSFGSDIAFATELVVRRPSALLPPSGPVLRISRVGAELWLSWNAAAYRLESANSLAGPWTTIDGATSPRLVQPSEPGRFFRLAKP